MRTRTVLFSAAVLLSACGKFGRLSEPGTTTVKFGMPRETFHPNAATQVGGVMIWGLAPDRLPFSLMLANETTTVSKTIPNGNWTFFAAGWTGSNPIEGTFRCGAKTASLAGTEISVDVPLAQACPEKTTFFSPSAYLNTPGQPKVLVVGSCDQGSFDAAPSSPTGTSDCVSGTGTIGSIQLEVPQFDATDNGITNIQISGKLLSTCISVSSKYFTTGIKMPVGVPGSGIPLATAIQAYTGALNTNCSGSATTFKFPKGLASGELGGGAKIGSSSTETIVLLNL